MKIIHVFTYFLIFVPIYCSLIPNNRVITDSDTNDFNLVEGITYNIVHLKSGLKLDSDGGRIYVNSVSGPYQSWSLRKANGSHYNIINVDSGLNLDSNGQGTYLSAPNDNSITNPYQYWTFTKIRDNIYNVVHVRSHNLDSNGEHVYIGTPEHSSKTNIYQQWLFEPSNYNLTAVIMNMEYPPDLKDKLEQYKTRTSLLSGNYIIENDSNATIEQTVDKTELKLNSYTLEVRKSESIKNTKSVNLSYHIGGAIFGLLGINTGFVGGIRREITSHHEKVYRETVTEAVSYHIRQKITVPPLNSVKVNSTVDKININNIPFEAKIKITGKADRLDENGRIISMTAVEVNAIRCYLNKENYDIKNITVKGNSLLIDTVGTLKVDGFGLETTIEAIPIPHDPKLPMDESPGNFVFLKNQVLYLPILLILCIILYRLYLNDFKRYYHPI